MEIKRVGSQPSSRGSADYFTGAVRLDPLFQAPDPALVSGGNVTFEPGARTAWHTHPYDEPGMLSGHSDFKSLTLRYRWALCRGRAFVTPHERFVREAGEVCRDGPVRARDDA
jgi:hypothetical protein